MDDWESALEVTVAVSGRRRRQHGPEEDWDKEPAPGHGGTVCQNRRFLTPLDNRLHPCHLLRTAIRTSSLVAGMAREPSAGHSRHQEEVLIRMGGLLPGASPPFCSSLSPDCEAAPPHMPRG